MRSSTQSPGDKQRHKLHKAEQSLLGLLQLQRQGALALKRQFAVPVQAPVPLHLAAVAPVLPT